MGSGTMAGGFDGWNGTSLAGGPSGTGPQGAQGAQGSSGTPGAQGAQGSSGTPGAQGAQGATGTGAQGLQGAAGAQGAQGFQGVTTFTPKQGTALTDADQTLQPGTDLASQYVQSTTLTALRTKILGVTSLITGFLCEIVRTDNGAFTMPIVNGGTSGGTLFTFGASLTVKQGFTAYYNGADWIAVGVVDYA